MTPVHSSSHPGAGKCVWKCSVCFVNVACYERPPVFFCRKTVPKFCYYCGRSVAVRLTPCYRCYKVFYCSRPCRLKAWDELHKNECVRVKAGTHGFGTAQQKRPPHLAKNQGVLKSKRSCSSFVLWLFFFSLIQGLLWAFRRAPTARNRQQ